MSIREVIAGLPAAWDPDIFIMRMPLYLMVPWDIDDSPIPTVCLFDDWFGGIDYLVDILRKLDYIFTDRATVSLLHKAGFDNVDYWPCFGYDPIQFKRLANVEKRYDISFTGIFNVGIQGNRMPLLKRLCGLPQEYSVRLLTNIWGSDYTRLLNESRIVFNCSIKGEMNMRAFEAPACGALLFMEDSNLEVREFFEPGRECVLYNKDNFEDLLQKHCNDRAASGKIAQAGWEKARNYSYPTLFRSLLDSIERKKLSASNRTLPVLANFTIPAHRDFIQISLSKFGLHRQGTIDRIGRLLPIAGTDPVALNDSAVILLLLLNVPETGYSLGEKSALGQQAESILRTAEKLSSGNAVVQYNLAHACLMIKKMKEAERIFMSLLGRTAKMATGQYRGMIYPLQFNFPFRVLWCMAYAEILPNEPKLAEKRHSLLRCFSAWYLGQLKEDQGVQNEAVGYYKEADRLLPHQYFIVSKLATLHKFNQDTDQNDSIFKECLLLNAFDPDIWILYAGMLLEKKNAKEGIRFIEQCLLTASRLNTVPEGVLDKLNDFKRRFEEI